MTCEPSQFRREAAQACTRAIHLSRVWVVGRRLPQSTNGNSRFKSSIRFSASTSRVSRPALILSTNTSQFRHSAVGGVCHGSDMSIPGISIRSALKRCTSTSKGTNVTSRDLTESVARKAPWQPESWVRQVREAPVDAGYPVGRERIFSHHDQEGGRHVTGSAVRAHESQSEAGRRFAGTAGRRETSSRRPHFSVARKRGVERRYVDVIGKYVPSPHKARLHRIVDQTFFNRQKIDLPMRSVFVWLNCAHDASFFDLKTGVASERKTIKLVFDLRNSSQKVKDDEFLREAPLISYPSCVEIANAESHRLCGPGFANLFEHPGNGLSQIMEGKAQASKRNRVIIKCNLPVDRRQLDLKGFDSLLRVTQSSHVERTPRVSHGLPVSRPTVQCRSVGAIDPVARKLSFKRIEAEPKRAERQWFRFHKLCKPPRLERLLRRNAYRGGCVSWA